MKILVTGAKGFVGRNLCAELKNRGFTDLYEYDLDTNPSSFSIWRGSTALRILRIL